MLTFGIILSVIMSSRVCLAEVFPNWTQLESNSTGNESKNLCPSFLQGGIQKRSAIPRGLEALMDKMSNRRASLLGRSSVRLRRLQPSEFLGKRGPHGEDSLERWSAAKKASELLGKRAKNNHVVFLGPKNPRNLWIEPRHLRGPRRNFGGTEFLGKRSHLLKGKLE